MSLILFLMGIWSCFMLWEFDVQTSLSTYSDSIIRYDLLILPFLIIITGYVIFILIRKQNPKSQSKWKL